MSYPSPLFERALVVANERSTNAKRVRGEIDAVREQLNLPVEVIMTSADNFRTRDSIYQKARDGDVVLSAGGDGTANHVVNTLLSPFAVELGIHTLPIVPLRGGNASDTATMLNGKKTATEILRSGQHLPINPIEVNTQLAPMDASVRYALGYFSVGATAESCFALDKVRSYSNFLTRVSGIQLAREVLTTLTTAANYSPFDLLPENDGSPLTEKPIVDYLFLRGDRIAKLGRPHARLNEPFFEAVETDKTGLWPTIVNLVRMQRGQLYGELGNSKQFSVASKDTSPLPVQYDGEATYIDSGSFLSVSIATAAYYTLSTQLK